MNSNNQGAWKKTPSLTSSLQPSDPLSSPAKPHPDSWGTETLSWSVCAVLSYWVCGRLLDVHRKWIQFSFLMILLCMSTSQVTICSTSLVQSLSCVWLFATPWTAACLASLSITNSCSLLILRSVTSVVPSNHLILCCPLLLPPSVFPQHQGLFQRVSSSHQVAKVLEFQV